MLKQAPYYEHVWGTRDIVPPILSVALSRLGGEFEALAVLPPERQPQMPLRKKNSVDPRTDSDHRRRENLCFCWQSNPSSSVVQIVSEVCPVQALINCIHRINREILASVILRYDTLFSFYLRMLLNEGTVEVLILVAGNPHDNKVE